MMFKKYMHVERLDSDEVDGLLIGTVQVQPKIDGSNCQVWLEDGELHTGSRNQEITGDNDHMGFTVWAEQHRDKLVDFLSGHPHWRLYGEWLVRHTLKTYREEAWRQFYVFDVYDDEAEKFIPYTEYQSELEDSEIDYIPVIAVVTNPTADVLQGFIERNTYLIQDGMGHGEGIVIKRYDFENKYGRTVWGKVVRNDFKEKHVRAMGAPEMELGDPDELQFVQQFITRGRVEKEIAKIEDWDRKQIPQLFGRVYHDVVTTELWDFVKGRKNRVRLDFNALYQYTVSQIKTVYPELF